MRRQTRPLAVMGAVAALVLGIAGCTATTDAPAGEPATTASAPATTLTAPPPDSVSDAVEAAAPPAGTDAAIAWEALMGPDGEYHAAASYAAVIDAFGDVEPYASIQAAEERHSEALIRQLERLGVEVPLNPYLGELAAPADLEAAALAWAEGEVANIEMYDRLLAETDDASLIRVLTNLRDASADVHLPAFEAAAANSGTLTAEQMSAFMPGRQSR